jgi:ABC-type phosphate transport system substrate-binding protein
MTASMQIILKLFMAVILSIVTTTIQAEVVVVVSINNPESSLTKEQASRIFLGKTATFPSGIQAIPIDQAEGSILRNEFYSKVAGKDATLLKVYWSRIIFTSKGHPPKELPDNESIKSLLRSSSNSIGYISKSAVDDTVKVLLTP